MTSRAWCPIVVLSFALSSLSPAATASAQQPESIPVELASALFGWRSGEPMTFHVGEAPPGFEVEWPDGARVLGGVVRGRGRATVVATVPGDPEEVWEELRTNLTSAGWVRAPEWNVRGGFTHAGQGRLGDFCLGEERRRSVVPAENAPGGTLFVIHDAPAHRSACDPSTRRPSGHPSEGLLPGLRIPVDGRMVRASGGASGAAVHSAARVETDLELGALLDHFGSQLEEAGWTSVSRRIVDEVGMTTWSLEHDEKPWEGYLVALATPHGNAHYLQVTAWNPRRVD